MSDRDELHALPVEATTEIPDVSHAFSRGPVATYSIVARDTETGQLGVAVQSHWFSVGTVVPWAEAGIGAVATQSMADPSYGPLGLDLMRAGRSAPDALAGLVRSDVGRDVRQVAMVDAGGRVAAHTGERCIEAAGHVVDDDLGVSCQANLMASGTVWGAMLDAYRASREAGTDLAERLIAGLEAAQAEGGDVRGKQSAALLVVTGEPVGRPWADRLFDLRVEDHPDPLVELRRLTALQRAYQHMNSGDAAIETGRFEEAFAQFSAARDLAPDILEIRFWTAVTLATASRYPEALQIFREVFQMEPFWRDLLPKLVKSELMSDAAAKRVLSDTEPTIDPD